MNPQLTYDIAERVHRRTQQGLDTIRLHVGESEGAPPAEVGNAVARAIAKGKTKYGSAYGEIELRRALARRHRVAVEQVLVGPGSKWLLYSLLHHLIRAPDDELLLPLPSWGAFPLMVQAMRRGRICPIPMKCEDQWQLPHDLDAYVHATSTAMVVVNPNNPTSTIQSAQAVERAREIARTHHLALIMDEAYYDLRFQPAEESAIDLAYEVRVRSFSKSRGMTGFRIGYCIAREEIVDALARFFQITVSCVPPFIQHAVVQTMHTEHAYTQQLREMYQKRFMIAESILQPERILYAKPDAAFYIFAKLPLKDTTTFAQALLNEKGVAVVPGSAFGPYPEYIRISLTETEERLTQGLTTLVETLPSYV